MLGKNPILITSAPTSFNASSSQSGFPPIFQTTIILVPSILGRWTSTKALYLSRTRAASCSATSALPKKRPSSCNHSI